MFLKKLYRQHKIVAHVLILFAIVVVLRSYVFETYRVVQDSMSHTLNYGDKVLVNRLSSSYKGNIVVVEQEGNTFIKRCVGLPGDVIQLIDGIVYINGTPVADPVSVINKTEPGVKNVDLTVYATYGRYWSYRNFGPYLIPRKGLTVNLDAGNARLYRQTIGRELARKGKAPQNNDLKAYTFTEDYYFVLGDNRPVSRDSRSFGVVNKKDIVGTVHLLLYSDVYGFSFKHMFQPVD